MDPLSVTLAAVSLATAMKDMVEVGQKIQKSFTKVTKNLRNAKRVAENIKEMLDEITTFCEDNEDVLADVKDFLLALQGLLGKFRSFETSILPLLPKAGRRKLGLFIGGWWNNNKIEESILDLQSDIVIVMRKYMMASTMRIEVKQGSNHHETIRGLTGIAKGLEVVRRDVSALCTPTAATAMSYGSYGSPGMSNEFTRNVIMFAESTPSTSAPMLRAPTVITEELMTIAYIKLQLSHIAMAVEKMSTLPASSATSVVSNSSRPFRLCLIVKQTSMNIVHLRHHVVRQVVHIRELLESSSIHMIPINDSSRALNGLSAGLKTLGMVPECILVGAWAITFARLVSTGGQRDCSPHLAMRLLNQCYRSTDKFQRLELIKEAYTITENLRNQYSGETHIQKLHSGILLEYAKFMDNPRSIEMSVEAVQILESILNVQAFTLSESHRGSGIIINNVVRPSTSFLDHLFSSEPSTSAIWSYTSALQALGVYLFNDGHYESALNLTRLAIAVHRQMVSIHGHEHKLGLVIALRSLVHGGIAIFVPGEELLDIADECIHLLRELTEKNPPLHARQLVNVLLAKANTLARLGQDAQAIVIWEEAADLAAQIVQDSALCARTLGCLSDQFRRLKRHEDAVRTGTLAITTYHEKAEIRAKRYFYLSRDLQQLRRYMEAADAARSSVALYQQLALKNPSAWTNHVTEGLSDLGRCLAASDHYSGAPDLQATA
ncbi:hypothetical protein D9619_012242 [Psilocybe cf. subviscida]|uniref:Uncharacterized protein n=1 Tax=Psilocybe cf. subviscida TaxID=2480587 RepID=A0A8H5EZI9_9AGAR|nr:hypothetical protein D9619_012242 [Psilocybe cf. subviscida]